MRNLATVLLVAPACVGLIFAQDTTATQSQTTPNQSSQSQATQNQNATSDQTATNTTGTGQSFVGILVDSNCSTASMPKTTPSDSWSNTTGSADRSSTWNNSKSSMSSDRSSSSSSTYDRSSPSAAGSTGAAASSDLNNTAAARDRARDVNQPPDVDSNLDRTTPATTGRATPGANAADNEARQTARLGKTRTGQDSDMSRSTANSTTTTNSTRDMAQGTTPASDMAARTSPTGSAKGPDTQSGNNTYGTADRSAHPNAMNETTGEMTSNTNSAKWDRGCFISPSTNSFVMQLQDGRTVRLDDASNQMITNRLQSTGRVQSMNKIFRVRVHGTMDGDVLHITDIQL